MFQSCDLAVFLFKRLGELFGECLLLLASRLKLSFLARQLIFFVLQLITDATDFAFESFDDHVLGIHASCTHGDRIGWPAPEKSFLKSREENARTRGLPGASVCDQSISGSADQPAIEYRLRRFTLE